MPWISVRTVTSTCDGVAAQNGSACVNRYIVLDGGMPLLAPQGLSATGGQSAQRYALVYLYIVADNGGLTDNDAGTVVNEEIPTHRSAGVDIDARNAVGVLCHDPGQHGNLQRIQHMGKAVHSDGKQARIGENDLILTESRGIPIVGCLQIGLHQRPHLPDLLEEIQTDLLRVFLGFRFSFSGPLEHQQK